MQRTSIETYKQITQEGLLTGLRSAVYQTLYNNGPLTQGELWKKYFFHRQRHDICPRFAELEARGVIACVDERPCKVTGRVARVYQTTNQLPQEPPKKPTNKQKIQRLEFELLEMTEQAEELQHLLNLMNKEVQRLRVKCTCGG
jgi:hypothetical protein